MCRGRDWKTRRQGCSLRLGGSSSFIGGQGLKRSARGELFSQYAMEDFLSSLRKRFSLECLRDGIDEEAEKKTFLYDRHNNLLFCRNAKVHFKH